MPKRNSSRAILVLYFCMLAAAITVMSVACACGFCRLLMPRIGI